VLAETGNPAEEVRRITGIGVQYAVETTGVPSVFTTITESLAPRGVAGVLGAAALGTSASLDIGSLLPMGSPSK
jgi:aryl-alcohol dehydrogenase